jgi:hypothetical protein
LEFIGNAISRLSILLDNDQIFFGDIAITILKNNWILKERHLPGVLYIDYGFKDGLV